MAESGRDLFIEKMDFFVTPTIRAAPEQCVIRRRNEIDVYDD